MLKPFAQDSKVLKGPRRPKTPAQYSLWGCGPAPLARKERPTDLRLEQINLQELTPLWAKKGRQLGLEDVQRLEVLSKRLKKTILSRVAMHYKGTKAMRLQQPSDVAVYLTLKDLDLKATKEIPEWVYQALDFGISTVVS